MQRKHYLIGLAFVLLAVGGYFLYGYLNRTDYRVMADDLVKDQWLTQFTQVDAVGFFQSGGHYIDFGDGLDEELIDRDVVLPLITRLNEEAGMDWKVLPDPQREGFAFAIVAKMPDSAEQRKKMEQIVAEEEAKFAGTFIEQKGYEWISYEFLTAAVTKEMEGMDF